VVTLHGFFDQHGASHVRVVIFCVVVGAAAAAAAARPYVLWVVGGFRVLSLGRI